MPETNPLTKNPPFRSSQLFWECRELSACANRFLRTYLGQSSTTPPRKLFSDASVTSESIDKRAHHYNAFCAWANAINVYSKASLSFDTDKLIAISGLARQLQPILKTDYLAGMLRKYLPLQLTWYCSSPGRRYPYFIAPSWSWASINGGAYLDDDDDKVPDTLRDAIEILEVQVTPLYGLVPLLLK